MINTNSHDWLAVREHCEKQLNMAFDRLKMPGLTATETEFERGKIVALEEVLKMPEQRNQS